LTNLKNKTGFTLFELIVAVAVLGLVMTSFQRVLGQSLATHKDTQEKLEQVSQARFAMDRMAMLLGKTGNITTPAQSSSADSLVLEERSMDGYNNLTQALGADGFLDADKDRNKVVNDDSINDPPDWITISLDKTDGNNWKLVETMPDYGPIGDIPVITMCENVTRFEVTRGSMDEKQHHVFKIQLDLGSGIHQVSLTTRAIAGKLLIL